MAIRRLSSLTLLAVSTPPLTAGPLFSALAGVVASRMILAAVFSESKKRILAKMTYFFVFYGPRKYWGGPPMILRAKKSLYSRSTQKAIFWTAGAFYLDSAPQK